MQDDRSRDGSPPDLAIRESVDTFINRNKPSWRGETERSYRKSLDTFEHYAADNELETLADLERWNVGKYTDYLLDQDYAPATVQSKQKQARRWLKWLESQGYLPVGLHLAIETLNLTNKEESSQDILEPDEMRRFLSFYRDSVKHNATRAHAFLEVIAHTGARRSGVRALDLDDYDPDARTLQFINRPETDTRLKRGDKHQRKVVLSEKPNEVLNKYVIRERDGVADEFGRRPLFTSRNGRPGKSTITNWMYQATFPCLMRECPHSRQRHSCPWTTQTDAHKCPSSTSPHPIRSGSITWQLNIGRSIEDVADRAATTPSVIRRFYDRPDLDEDLRRRVTQFDGIDICEHTVPEDVDSEVNP